MSKTANIFARVEPEVKEGAEAILDSLGISMSNAVSMFLRQVIIQKGIPFEVKLDVKKPLCMGELTEEQLAAELEKGMEDIREGRVYSIEEVGAELKRLYNI